MGSLRDSFNFKGEFDNEDVSVLSRWYRLRKLGLCKPLLQDGVALWLFEPINRWTGERTRISIDQLRLMVEEGERQLNEQGSSQNGVRKDVGSSERAAGWTDPASRVG